ncbi:MAG TPA: hypothetical protein VN622_02605 [Clostridia bacterium]|nr:hypothetical protein [Clostridia bacterium]
MPANQFDVCAGGTVPAGNNTTSLTLTNHHREACNISGLNLPNANPSGPDYTVPAKTGPTAGSLTISFTPDAGSYPYSSSCCPQAGNPVIVIQ